MLKAAFGDPRDHVCQVDDGEAGTMHEVQQVTSCSTWHCHKDKCLKREYDEEWRPEFERESLNHIKKLLLVAIAYGPQERHNSVLLFI